MGPVLGRTALPDAISRLVMLYRNEQRVGAGILINGARFAIAVAKRIVHRIQPLHRVATSVRQRWRKIRTSPPAAEL
jgi:hypothetical protein